MADLRREDHLPDWPHDSGEPALLFFLPRPGGTDRLGHADAARMALAEGIRVLDRHWPQGAQMPDMGLWTHWVHSQVLRSEAEALLKTAAAPNKPPD